MDWIHLGISLVTLAVLARTAPAGAEAMGGKALLTVSAGAFDRRDVAVTVDLSPRGPGRVVDVRQLDPAGKVVDDATPFDASDPNELIVQVTGVLKAGQSRRYEVTFGPASAGRTIKPQVTAEQLDDYQGQSAIKLTTPNGTWVYHQKGAGFASLVDRDGRDWISYRPGGGSAGEYRGIPNLVHPEGYFHPGGTQCTTRVIHRGPLRVALASSAEKGTWSVRWDLFPDRAEMTVLKAPKAYWFLYEGTPGGKIDLETDFCLRPPDRKTAAGRRWDDKLPLPAWVVFGDAKVGRSLVVVNHNADRAADSYWPMQGNMTVFGFGRRDLDKSLRTRDARFTVRLVESAQVDELAGRALSAAHPPRAEVAPAGEAR